MLRKIAALAFVVAAVFAAFTLTGAEEEPGGRTIKIPFDNAFGLTEGGDLRVGGVTAGTTKKFGIAKGDICQSRNRQGGPPRTCAIVEAKITEPGFESFRADATCDIRQQSLIGEYYVDCQPGSSRQELPDDTVSIDNTTSTIPADLVQNVMRRPYRERLRLIVAELGTGVAGRPQDINELLRKAHPGLRETSKTLEILENQTDIIKDFISDSDTVVAELEDNKQELSRWVDSAQEAASVSAERGDEIERGFERLPTFLAELEPTMARLGELTDEQTPLLADLQRAAPDLNETLTRLGPFSEATRPALRSLGETSDKGTRVVRSSAEEIDELRKLAANAPALGKPLRQLLQTADDRSRGRPDTRAAATAPPDPDPTSIRNSKRTAFTAFESLLNYVFWQTLAINEFDSISHQLRVLLVVGSECAPYANAEEAKDKERAEHCNAWLGPYQPGITDPDPTEDGAADQLGERKIDAKSKKRRRAGDPEAPPTPGRPDPSQPQITLPPAVQDIANSVIGGVQSQAAPSESPAPSAGSGGSQGSQPPAPGTPQELLDFLLAP